MDLSMGVSFRTAPQMVRMSSQSSARRLSERSVRPGMFVVWHFESKESRRGELGPLAWTMSDLNSALNLS